jgi:hypothetical protein
MLFAPGKPAFASYEVGYVTFRGRDRHGDERSWFRKETVWHLGIGTAEKHEPSGLKLLRS